MFEGVAARADEHDDAAFLIDEVASLQRVIVRAQARQAVAIASFAQARRREDEEAGLPDGEA